MADNSVMTNITAVENYGKNLQKAQEQLIQITQQIKKQTESIGNIWKDGQFQNFKADFNENIYKPVMKAAAMMENEAHYIKKTVELQREIQKLKIR
jgi:UDP-3-O-acyl-N-acetylglucosamine deacetylase